MKFTPAMLSLAAALSLAAGAATARPALEDGQDVQVVGVSSSDSLPVLAGPASNYPKLSALNPNENDLTVVSCVPFGLDPIYGDGQDTQEAWCLVERGDLQLGWVDANHLKPIR